MLPRSHSCYAANPAPHWVALDLSRYPQAQSLDVRPHDLEIYDDLARTKNKDNNDDDDKQ